MRKKFLNYLKSTGVAKASIKHYSSDFIHFERWLNQQNISIVELNSNHASAYKDYLLNESFSNQTINRKLSTMRRFSEYLHVNRILDRDFANETVNIPNRHRSKGIKTDKLISEFKKHLKDQKASKSTIKNYISDVKHFISWLDSNYSSYN